MFDDVDHAASLFNLQSYGYIYSRLTNPTVSVLEERLATLEGGRGAICTATGHAAQMRAMLHHFRNPRLLATFTVGFGMLFALVSTFTYVTFYLAAPPFNLSTAALSYLFAIYLIGLVVTPEDVFSLAIGDN